MNTAFKLILGLAVIASVLGTASADGAARSLLSKRAGGNLRASGGGHAGRGLAFAKAWGTLTGTGCSPRKWVGNWHCDTCSHLTSQERTEVRKCAAVNAQVCAANGGPTRTSQKCHAGLSSSAPQLHGRNPVTEATAAWTNRQQMNKIIGVASGITSSVASAAGQEEVATIAGYIPQIVSYAEDVFGKTPQQCKNGQTAIQGGKCIDWQTMYKDVQKYVRSYVHYELVLQEKGTLSQTLKTAHQHMKDIAECGPNCPRHSYGETLRISSINELDTLLNANKGLFQTLLEHSAADFKAAMGAINKSDGTNGWMAAAALPRYATMHLTAKLMKIALYRNTISTQMPRGDASAMFNVAKELTELVSFYNTRVDHLYTRMLAMRRNAMKTTAHGTDWHNTRHTCYDGAYGHIDTACDPKYLTNRPSAMTVVSDTWPECSFERTFTNTYELYSSSHDCVYNAHCLTHDYATECKSQREHHIMQLWTSFWDKELQAPKQLWRNINHQAETLMDRVCAHDFPTWTQKAQTCQHAGRHA